jgi:hypothetical protein
MADWINNFIWAYLEAAGAACFKRVCAVKKCCPVGSLRKVLWASAYKADVGNILREGPKPTGRMNVGGGGHTEIQIVSGRAAMKKECAGDPATALNDLLWI